ncbi:hypothetical protein B5M09_003089 [Aphanomyces astaci]|uniref:Myosin motor domain-containing protein n=1 Tax=Aphanomyces astaci TaxID=112090 RepID=A0A425D5Q4_APHAT|nr:hypothetical protein B5M09_003089 [Aphanomyces astaci]
MNEGPVWGRNKTQKDGATYSWVRGTLCGDEVDFEDGRTVPWSTIDTSMEILRGNVTCPMDLDDLGMLTHLNEPSMVHCLEERFLGDKVYCHTGDMLLAVNPFKVIPKLYDVSAFQSTIASSSNRHRHPHVFTTAHETYRALTVDKHKNQTVLVSGESGSGKTETTKFIMQYLAAVSHTPHSTAPSHECGTANISDQVLQSNPILESFGNARTLRNDNSSRFGKFVKIWFATDSHHAQLRLVGTSIETYLLEKVRLVHQATGERNFHIFYEVLAGAAQDRTLQTRLHLADPMDVSKFAYLNQSGCVTRRDQVSDADTFHKTMRAMSIVGFQAHVIDSILGVVGGLLHLGNMTFGSVTTGDAPSSEIRSPQPLAYVSELLAVDVNRLREALTSRQIKAKDEWYQVHLTPQQADDARDALARSIYGYLFEWVVAKVNRCIGSSSPLESSKFIGVLDIFGFESFDVNSFEQLCINYANERLQHHFIDFVMTQEQGRYQSEGIPWTLLELPMNDGCLEVLEARPTGVLALLDEECNVPKGSDAGFVRKLYQIYHSHAHFQASKRDQVNRAFVVVHYAGAVRYTADGFCEKNRDKPHQAMLDLLASSENPFVRVMCRLSGGDDGDEENDDPRGGPSPPIVMRRKSSIVSTGLGAQFRRQLQHLLDMITHTTPHYIRCLKPNDANVKHTFDRQRMADQLRYGGVLEAVTISRLGYPVHMAHPLFVGRYGAVLLPPPLSTSSHNRASRHSAIDAVLTQLVAAWGAAGWPRRDSVTDGVVPSKWFAFGIERGKTLVFLRQSTYDFLESTRAAALHKHAVTLQAFAKMAFCRHKYWTIQAATATLQRLIRGHLARQHGRRIRATRLVAVWLQARYRGRIGRQIATDLRRQLGVVCLQSCWRGAKQRRAFLATLAATRTIQCAWRCRLAKLHVKQLRKDALSLQHTIVERNQLRQELHQLKTQATMANQRAEEAETELRRLQQMLVEMQQTTMSSSPTMIAVSDAALRGDAALVLLLLQHHASVTITDFVSHATAFHVAAQMANMEISGYTQHRHRSRSLSSYSIFCRPDVFPSLDVNMPDKDGNTVLHLACASCRPKAAYVMELYLMLGADANAQNVLGRSPLHICTLLRRDDELVGRLLACGADPNLYSIDRKTPLHIAVKRGSHACLSLFGNLEQAVALVKSGASMTLPDAHHKRVLHASAMAHQSISNYLEGRFHDMYAATPVHGGGDDDDDGDEWTQPAHLKSSLKSATVGMLEPLKTLKAARTTKELVRRTLAIAPTLKATHSTVNLTETIAPVERKLPPLFYRMRQVWATAFTSPVSEEERLGLPTVENARMLFGIDIYEAKVCSPLEVCLATVPLSLTKFVAISIYGREGQMRENMTKAVFSIRTSTRIMAILKQIDSFSIFLDSKPKKDLPPASPAAGPAASDVPLDEVDENSDDDGESSGPGSGDGATPPKPTTRSPTKPPVATVGSTDIAAASPSKPNAPAVESVLPLIGPHTPGGPTVDLVGVYLQQCAVQQVLPSKRVISQLPALVVDCAHFNLGHNGIIAMAHALQHNTALVELNLTDNWSLEPGGHQLAQVVASCPHLTTLDLTNNRIGTRSAMLLFGAVTSSSTLSRLVLKGNDLYDRIHTAVGALLATNPSLTFLDLSDNRVRNKTGTAIGHALLANTHLQALHLTWNTMSTTGCLPILTALATTNQSLKHLSLGWNRLGDETGCLVATMLLRNQTLESLDLTSAQLSCASVGFLADAVTFNEGLARLNLDQNPIDQTGVSLMLQAAKQRERSKKHPLRLSLEHMVFKHRATDAPPPLPYDPRDPSGYYRLSLKVPVERTAFELLKRRHELHLGTFHHVVANKFKVDANHLGRIPPNATVRFEYVATAAAADATDDMIHFRLDLAKPSDRAMARALMERAEAESGENWINETLDGVPFDFDELAQSGIRWLDGHPTGVLELDYITTTLFCESHYKLKLQDKSDRAMAWKLLERVQRSQNNSHDVGDEWRHLTLDGAPLSLEAWAVAQSVAVAALSTATKWKWRVPMQGTIEFDYFTPHPHHVLAHHYRLDLANDADRVLAHELRVRSLDGIGECWWNEEIDGYPFRLTESLDVDFDFPTRGLLEFDFILLRPAHFVTTMTIDECQRFDLGAFDDFLCAEFLRRVAVADSYHYVWTNAAINGAPYVVADTMLPPTGWLSFTGLVFLGKDPSPVEMISFLIEVDTNIFYFVYRPSIFACPSNLHSNKTTPTGKYTYLKSPAGT